MKTVTGIYTSAIIYHTNNPKTSIEPYALAQIQMLCDNPAFEGSKIRIMPDVHPERQAPSVLLPLSENRSCRKR